MSALLWDITQCVVVIPYRSLGTNHRSEFCSIVVPLF